ncbi:MAG: hypothetical protein KDJ25_00985 [Rhodoblastus sp.]|nr:hypothetical protein [Rhodoblastus sp.]
MLQTLAVILSWAYAAICISSWAILLIATAASATDGVALAARAVGLAPAAPTQAALARPAYMHRRIARRNRSAGAVVADCALGVVTIAFLVSAEAPACEDCNLLSKWAPVAMFYSITAAYLTLYWADHHALIEVVHALDRRFILHDAAFVASLAAFPFTTAWVVRSGYSRLSVCIYGLALLVSLLAYMRLRMAAANVLGDDPKVRNWFGAGAKGRLLVGLFAAGSAAALVSPVAGTAVFALTVGVWTVAEALQ